MYLVNFGVFLLGFIITIKEGLRGVMQHIEFFDIIYHIVKQSSVLYVNRLLSLHVLKQISLPSLFFLSLHIIWYQSLARLFGLLPSLQSHGSQKRKR